MRGFKMSLHQTYLLLLIILPCVVSDNCWIAQRGQMEWCDGYCCDSTNNGWTCCCDDEEDIRKIIVGLVAISMWVFGVLMYILKVVLCYLGGDVIWIYAKQKLKRKLAKWRRGKDELNAKKLEEENRLRRLIRQEMQSSASKSEEWNKMAKLYFQDECFTDEESAGREFTCMCCEKYRFSFGKM